MASLQSLKDKLNSLESNLLAVDDSPVSNNPAINSHKINQIPLEDRLNNKLSELVDIQGNKLTIDAGGKKYPITKSLLNECQYESLIKDMHNQNKDSAILFLDCSQSLFKYIIKLFREFHKGADCKVYSEEKRYNLVVKDYDDKSVLEELIKIIFVYDYESLLGKIQIIKKSDFLKPEPVVVPVAAAVVNNYDYGGAAAYDYGGGAARNYDY